MLGHALLGGLGGFGVVVGSGVIGIGSLDREPVTCWQH